MNLYDFIPVFLAIVAYLGWGIGDALSIKLFRSNNPSVITFNSGVGRVLIWLLFLPFFYKNLQLITITPFIYNIIAGIGSGLGYYFFGKAAKYTNPSLVAAIGGGWGASALIIALIVFQESVSVFQWLSIFLIFLGLFMVTFRINWVKKIFTFKDKGIIYALGAFVVWGICGAFIKVPALAYGWYWTTLILFIPYFIVLLFEVKNIKRGEILKVRNTKLFLVYILLLAVADFGYNSSFQFGGQVAVIGTIGGSYATLTTFLTNKIYKEPLSVRQKTGIIISLLGIVLTSYFSSISI
ncbi:EamA family transporter [Patescibacteria group bacterium]